MDDAGFSVVVLRANLGILEGLRGDGVEPGRVGDQEVPVLQRLGREEVAVAEDGVERGVALLTVLVAPEVRVEKKVEVGELEEVLLKHPLVGGVVVGQKLARRNAATFASNAFTENCTPCTVQSLA